jgi:hypothetical protein
MKCPHCNRDVGNGMRDEITHMEHYHPDIVKQRLDDIGEQYVPTLYDFARTAMQKLTDELAKQGIQSDLPIDVGIPAVVEEMEKVIHENETRSHHHRRFGR